MVEVRDAVLADVDDIARIHVQSWQETYRGIVSDERLDDPEFITRRRAIWESTLSGAVVDGTARVALGVLDDVAIGFGSIGPSRSKDLADLDELWCLYALASAHGSGVGAALVEHLLGDRPALLWVEERNPRARAFYRKMGFVEDGVTNVEGPFREIRMVR